MAKSFIERLTDEQIVTFLEKNCFPKIERYSCSLDRQNGYINVRVDKVNTYLLDFELRNYDVKVWSGYFEWPKYLYEIFGEEYKKAFLAEVAEIFD